MIKAITILILLAGFALADIDQQRKQLDIKRVTDLELRLSKVILYLAENAVQNADLLHQFKRQDDQLADVLAKLKAAVTEEELEPLLIQIETIENDLETKLMAIEKLMGNNGKNKLVLKEDTLAYDLWKNVPADITFSIYLYNLTNGPEVANSGVKPAVKEVGPYTFREKRHKENITFLSNGTVTYQQRVLYIFDKDLSPGVSLDDTIVHFNYAIVSTSSVLSTFPKNNQDVYLKLLNDICEDKVMNVDCGLVQQHNVLELLFEGYHDKFLQASSWVAPTPGSRFGLLLNHNDSTIDGFYNVFTGEADQGLDNTTYGMIDLWKESSDLGHYRRNSMCDALKQSTLGDLSVPQALHNEDPINLLYPNLCRTFRLDYTDKREVKNMACKRYTADKSLFDYETHNGENKCFCKDDKSCPANGVCDISGCYWSAPIYLGYPHFLHADPNLIKDVDYIGGLNPKKSDHQFYIDVETNMGFPIVMNAELQINLKVVKDDRFPALKSLKQDTIMMPLAWFRLHLQLQDEALNKIKMASVQPNSTL